MSSSKTREEKLTSIRSRRDMRNAELASKMTLSHEESCASLDADILEIMIRVAEESEKRDEEEELAASYEIDALLDELDEIIRDVVVNRAA